MFPLYDENLPGRGLAYVILALIAINVVVFLFLQEATGENAFTYGWSAVPLEITTNTDLTRPVLIDVGGDSFRIPQEPGPDPIFLTLLSSMFMHGSFLHLGGNMLFLWIFGDNVEHYAGRFLFILAYLATGVVGSLAQILSDPTSPIPTLGASGAISGVLGMYIVLFPGNKVTAFIFRFLVQVSALVAIGMWIAFQFLDAFLNAGGVGGVAYLAHIGGFASGAAVGLLLRGRGDRGARLAGAGAR